MGGAPRRRQGRHGREGFGSLGRNISPEKDGGGDARADGRRAGVKKLEDIREAQREERWDGRFFYFFIFNFRFFKNIFSFSKFTGIYPAAPLPGGRDLAARRPPGSGWPGIFL